MMGQRNTKLGRQRRVSSPELLTVQVKRLWPMRAKLCASCDLCGLQGGLITQCQCQTFCLKRSAELGSILCGTVTSIIHSCKKTFLTSFIQILKTPFLFSAIQKNVTFLFETGNFRDRKIRMTHILQWMVIDSGMPTPRVQNVTCRMKMKDALNIFLRNRVKDHPPPPPTVGYVTPNSNSICDWSPTSQAAC